MRNIVVVLLAVLLMLPALATAGDLDFKPLYDKDAVCFMSLNYEGVEGPAPKQWEIKEAVPHRMVFVRVDGEQWLKMKGLTVTDSHEYLPCFKGRTVGPAWLCPVIITPPPKPEPVSIEPKKFVVYFDFDKSDIRADQIATLEAALAYAQQGGVADIMLDADCDFRGSDEYNVGLGQRRADAVANWLADNGLDLPMSVDNHGKGRSTIFEILKGKFCKDCWADRKVEITIQ